MTDATNAAEIDVKKVERAALLLHFDDIWAERILHGDVLALTAQEKALFGRVDRRGFHADGERKARAVAVVAEELPVGVAVAGLPRLFSLFRSDRFLDVVVAGRSLVEIAAAWLDNEPARIEGAIARARRRRRAPRAPVTTGIGVAAAVVADDTLPRWMEARVALGADTRSSKDVVAEIARGRRLPWAAPSSSVSGVLVTGGPAAPQVAGCASALARLLCACDDGLDDDAFVAEAITLGCEDAAEARALREELVRDGLLV